MSHLPLKNLKVIELTHMVMGPAVGLILADMGADVIKVEPTDGDATRRLKGSGAGYFPMYNRNKRSLAVDIKSSEGRNIVYDLLREADIFVENFRRGTVDRLGFGYEKLKEINRRLIFCSEKGFLPGPYENRTALDEVAQMMGGLAYMTGPPGRPLRAGSSVIDITGGMFGVIGILAALHEREVTGEGSKVISGLFETTVFMVGQHMAQAAITGEAPRPMPARISAWAIYDVFETSDNDRLFIGVVSDKQWPVFCDTFGLDELKNDPGLRTNSQRVEQRDRVLPIVRTLCKQYTLSELVARLENSGLPFAPIMRPEDMFDNPHLNAGGGLVDIMLPDGRRNTKLPTLPIEFGGARSGLRRHPPAVGEHSTEILDSLGFTSDEAADLISRKIIGTSMNLTRSRSPRQPS